MNDYHSNTRHERGTVLILCVALLVILGMLASGFVILAHANKSSSRALGRADNFEQVRQISLAYVQALLLEDLVGDDGIFLNNDPPGSNDEAYDAPGADDPWLASHWDSTFGGWLFLTNITGDSTYAYVNVRPADLSADLENCTDTDGDTVRDTWWIPADDDYPFTNLTAADGTVYRVAIRIVDTNGLGNINVGMGQDIIDIGPDPDITRKTWDGQFPYCLYLAGINAGDNGANLDSGGSVAGRIPSYSDLHTALTDNLYPYLANPNPPAGANYIRPFDVAEELALRMQAGPGTDLHGRLGTLWPNTFGTNSDWLTAYSWTMQIRPRTPVTTTSGHPLDPATGGLGEIKQPSSEDEHDFGALIGENTKRR